MSGEHFVFAGEFAWRRTRVVDQCGEHFVFAGEFAWRRTRAVDQ